MLEMPLNCEYPDDEWFSNPALAFTQHNTRFVIGSVRKTWIDGENFMCSGIIWKDNFADVAWMIQNAKDALGFSVELYPLEHEVQADGFDHVTKLEFTGLTICWKNVAAFSDTFLTQLAASRKIKNEKVDDTMTPEEMKAMLEGFTQSMTAEIAKVQSSVESKVDALESKIKAQEEAEKVEAAKKVEADALAKVEAEKEALKAELAKVQATAIPAPVAVQTAAPKGNTVDYTGEFAKINQMNCSVSEKVKLRASLALKATAI
jgi:hypothetical protein